MSTLQGAKYLWKLPEYNQQLVSDLVLANNLSFPIVQTLVSRGHTTQQACEQFLFSSYEKDVAHPGLLKDAHKAVDRIIFAIKNNQKILIAGDYDVDGITSSALMMICLAPLGAQVNFFLPHRVNDGYGLSIKTVQRAAQNGYNVIITVDNGITAFEPALEAKKLGIDLIITDHHRPHDHLPEAFAVIDPYQAGCEYPYKKFAGVGVGFKIMTLLYERMGLELPAQVYELLLLGTVADVVPLTGENRFWVRHGLQKINALESLALKTLKQNARFTKPAVSSQDIGFFITPQINALGRLEDPRQGVKFLVGADALETAQIGKVLGQLNEARKAIERSVLADVEVEILEKRINLEHDSVIIAASSKWPPGVIGLVASRLVSAYGRPAILLHLTANGLAKGSCRSIAEFNMFDALAASQDLLESFGGHSVAAGLSLRAEKLPELKARLQKRVNDLLTVDDLKQKIKIDAELTLPEANKKLMSDMSYLEPFGCENSQPLFRVKNVTILENPILLKDVHIKCELFADGITKSVIFFNRPELFERLIAHKNEPFDIAAYVTENHWNGRVNVELQGIDIAGLPA